MSVVYRNAGEFPLSVHWSGRYFVDRNGNPFFLHGDAAWSVAAQLSDSEIDQYIDARAAQGFNAILFSAIEHFFSDNAPANIDGVNPFASMTDFASGLTSAYWTRVDRIVNRCKARGIVCIINPAYLGFAGSEEGWDTEVSAETAGDLQTYGTALANRYTQGNIIWCLGGDQDPDNTLRDLQWNIVTGMRSVRTTDIITAHGAPDSRPYSTWSGKVGFNFNNVYQYGNNASVCATEYGVGLPFILFESDYEGSAFQNPTAAEIRKQHYQALCSGACGHIFGNNPVWFFSSVPGQPPTGAWQDSLNTTITTQIGYMKTLFTAYQWWKLVPKADASLVSSSLGTGDATICPALSSDGAFAFIWVPSSQTITVVTNALTGVSGNVRIRRFNVTAGDYTTINAGVAKTSDQSVATGAEGVIVIDAA